MHESLEFRPLTEHDLPAAMRLKTIAGWNQTEEDWKRFIELDPKGTFVACRNGEVVATGSTITHDGHVAWIGMILVDPKARRQGIGTKMLHHCIDYLKNRGVASVKLDATPMGQPVYEEFGFLPEYGAARWEGTRLKSPSRTSESPEIVPFTANHREALQTLDTPIFGCNRSGLLVRIRESVPDCAGCVPRGSTLDGFVMARIGTDAHHIGPLVANDPQTAHALLTWAIERARSPRVFIDIPSHSGFMIEMLAAMGMVQQRPFLRMYLGSNSWPGILERVYAIAGPELG